MAWIQPNSKVYLLAGVPVDSDYNHTMSHIQDASRQFQMFSAFIKPNYGTYTEQYYQRINKNTLRLAVLADNIYDVNYMMFQNTSFGNKWFYAFVKEVNYVNNNATEIVYELDVMQTWYFDYELGECFVEREHTATDHWGENLVPENLEIGESVTQSTTNAGGAQGLYKAVIAYLPNQTDNNGEYIQSTDNTPWVVGTGSVGKNWDKAYSPLEVVALDAPVSATALTEVIRCLTSAKCEIVSIFIVPKQLWEACTPELTNGIYVSTRITGVYTQTIRINNFTSFGNMPGQTAYTPKNNKIYTYPYVYLFATNNKGNSTTLKFEGFRGSTPRNYVDFTLKAMAQPCGFEEALIPTGYNGAGTMSMGFENCLTLNDFPRLSWSIDSYQDYMQRYGLAYGLSVAGNLISDAVGIGIGVASENVNYAARAGANAVGDVLNVIGTLSKLRNAPAELSGQSVTTLLQLVNDKTCFTIHVMGLKPEMAEIIDNYFNMFGYAVNKVKIPNIRDPQGTWRPHWNYVKTGTCVIHAKSGSGLPADAEKKIAEIYNKGITFWKTPSEVGNYSLDNKPNGWVAWG